MLITMLVVWATDGYPHYSDSMEPTQNIAYISGMNNLICSFCIVVLILVDIGAHGLKPLFIAMSSVTAVSFDVVFILERWLRHTGRLAPNTSIWQKLYSIASVIAAVAGAVGLILLSIFDTVRYHRLHQAFLGLFIGGYIVSAIFICWEYQRLGIHYKSESVLRYSFWIKLAFIIIELALAIAFGVCGRRKQYNAGAVLEWVIAFIFFSYVLSFFIDFMPAVRSKNRQSRATEMDVAEMELGDGAANGRRYFRGAPTGATATEYPDRYANAKANGHTNGHTKKPKYPPPNHF
jgi:hypothetical protein